MRTLNELEGILYNPKQGLDITASELHLLIQNNEWLILWNALVFAEFRDGDFGVLIQLQKSIRFPELDPAITLHTPQVPNISDNQPVKDVWKNIIIPYLSLRDQINLSQVNQFFFKLSSDLNELKQEFPSYFKDRLRNGEVINPQTRLAVLRALAYPEPLMHLRYIFCGIVKNLSASGFLQIASAKSLRQWIVEERHGDDTLLIEQFSPLTMSVKLDRLTTMLFFLSCTENNTPQNIDHILTICCQYGATTILQFFLWAFPNNDFFEFDSYFPVACEFYQLPIVKLLASRAHSVTLKICLARLEKDAKATSIVDYLMSFGTTLPENKTYYTPKLAYYSDLMKEIIRNDLGKNLSLFLKIWPVERFSTLFYHICNRWYKQENIPIDVIAFLLSRSKGIQTHHDADKSFSRFIVEISNSNKLKSFLTVYLPKWNVKFLPASRSKMITAVCRAGHIENFKVLLDDGVDINTRFSSKKHVLSSPLSRVAFCYSRLQNIFNYLIQNGAIFTQIAACHAIEGGQLAGLQALMRLPDANISDDSLEYHPLFVAAQFGRLDCFDYLMSQGITFEFLTIEQLWDFVIQGAMAGLLTLTNTHGNGAWWGHLYKMRQRLLTKMIRAEIGNKYGFPEANPFEFPRFIKEKSDVYLKIISMILPYVEDKILDNEFILSIAVGTGNLTLVLLILAYSPAINALDEKGNSCLLVAINGRYRDIVAALLEYGANFEIGNHAQFPINAASDNPEILALLLNSTQYATLNFPYLPNKSRCQSCLPYLTEKSNNLINPQLAECLYERHRLHPDICLLVKIILKIEEITLGNAWEEHGFGRIIINNTFYTVPGIIADIYHHAQNLYKLPYSEAMTTLPAVYQSIQDLATRIKGFRLRFYSTTTVQVCNQIENWIYEKIDDFSKKYGCK
ncbi:MAG: ankyrin repeat domain-containing protein [Gammaproteobacteria bacterium]|nr:ankyrin repeat domain-containing protein [Gammaproteobacteria bacterium]